jgi:cell pole-organizing protein PopZ
MFPRRLAQRATTLKSTTIAAARPLSSTVVAFDKHNKHAKSPALADVTPENAHVFDQRTQEFRAEVAERIRREREQKESQSASAKAFAEAKQSSSQNTASSSSVDGVGSQSATAPSTSAVQNDTKQKKVGSGPLSKLIYGTEEGRKMDQEIERSFSQVLARGKYVHSIVFHEVKPSKVDEYVELVGNWYPRMANMPENKVCWMINGFPL